jgi:hypothetical protein
MQTQHTTLAQQVNAHAQHITINIQALKKTCNVAFYNAIHTALNTVIQQYEALEDVDIDVSSYIVDDQNNAIY